MKKHGCWQQVNDTVIREKVGYVFRDLLGDRYRSSSLYKGKVRRQEQELEQQEQERREKRVQSQQTLHFRNCSLLEDQPMMSAHVHSNGNIPPYSADGRSADPPTADHCFSLEPLRIFESDEVIRNNESRALCTEVLGTIHSDDFGEDISYADVFEPLELDITQDDLLGARLKKTKFGNTLVGVKDGRDNLIESFYMRRLVNGLDDCDIDNIL